MVENDLNQEYKNLISNAKDALSNAYAPYSGFHVGTALLLENGTVVTGANQENAAYPLCMCAERVALYTKATLHRTVTIKKMVVVAKKANAPGVVPATPCGACRQVILEFEARQSQPIEILMLVEADNWIVLPSAQALLPYGFTGSNLRM
jgi:cytidine deaminase